MTVQSYSGEQLDALQEVVNIAMGQAGASLASVFDIFVQLSVPNISIMTVENTTDCMVGIVGKNTEISAVRQAFYDSLRGEAILIFKNSGCGDLADLMGYENELDSQNEQELMLDVSNILVGAVLCGIAEILDTELSFSAPSIIALGVHVEDLFRPSSLSWSHALLIEVNFSLEARDFTCHLVILMPEESIERMRHTITRFMESM